jgi:phosphoribosylcarboxyaminoimidazole (NCAIR) mutase
MSQIARAIDAIREDRRADYLWDTDVVSKALHVHPNKFSDWWYRTRDKLIDLMIAQPGQTAAELAALIASAEAERSRRQSKQP